MTTLSTRRLFHSTSSGFTLVELIVALGLFILVVSISTTIFLQASRSQKLVAERVAALDTISFVVEQMAREVRTGSGFSLDASSEPCPLPLSGRGVTACRSGIRFTNYRDVQVLYRLVSDQSPPSGAVAYIERSEGGGDPLRLTPKNVSIDRFSVLSYRDARYAKALPRFTISLTASGPFTEPLELQTTVSPRIFYYQKGGGVAP